MANSSSDGQGERNGKEPDHQAAEVFARRVEAVLPLLAFAMEQGDSHTILAILVVVLAIRAVS